MGSPDHAEVARDLDDIANSMRRKYRCHTAILYGSRASGDTRPDSDYDVAGFAEIGAVERVTGAWRGAYLDLFVYPESKLAPTPEMLHLRGGKVLFQDGRVADDLLSALDKLYAAGPEALPDSELKARRNWAWKMLDRARRADAEGNFRRAWLLTALLEDYFHFRAMWYEGPKKALSFLAASEPHIHAKFEAALLPGANLDNVTEVVEIVAGSRMDAGDV